MSKDYSSKTRLDVHQAVTCKIVASIVGGRRAYFQCPRCFKEAEILYEVSFFACRRCHVASDGSQCRSSDL